MHIKANLKKSLFFIVIVSCMLVGPSGYSAIKKIPPQESLPQNQNFPKNESGETYGSASGLTPYEREPDLLKAIGIDGTIGYVRQTELAGEQPKTPEEALAQQAKQTVRYVNLYESDGKTIIGKFKISPRRSVMKDENGKIIEPSK